MYDFELIEEYYNKFVKQLDYWIPEGFCVLNLELLHRLDLLHFSPVPVGTATSGVLESYFQMMETEEKLTLVNDQFIIWIFPDMLNGISVTFTLIALNNGDEDPHLELAFVASGVYNHSSMIMKTLEKFLAEIQENERLLASYEKPA